MSSYNISIPLPTKLPILWDCGNREKAVTLHRVLKTNNVMKKRLVLLIVIFTFLAGFQAFAEDSVRVSSADLQALIRRVERLEQQQAQTGVSPQMGIAPAGTQKKGLRPEVDAETGATVKKVGNGNGRLTFGGYGEATFKQCFFSNNYLRYGKNPEKYKGDRYAEFDLPHVVFYIGYDFGKGWSMASEIEFEHGGPEIATEIEEEEGGEYESEVERGGEVALEQFWLQKRFNDYAVLRAGMQIVPVGGTNAHHEPNQYFGVYRPEGEFTILPCTWHEVALTFMGKTPFGLHYQAMFLPGLDSDRFGRKNWVKKGAGSPYEFKLGNALAGAARVDYTGVRGLRLSLSGYLGNSFRNTLSLSSKEIDNSAYKDVRGTVSVGSFDFCYNDHNVILRGAVTYGHLTDAQAITQYNIGMRKGSVSSKQWVGSDAIATGVEIGYDFFSLNPTLQNNNQRFYLFGRYDYYDSMFRNPEGKKDYTYAWCGRQRLAVGINYYPLREVAIKAEFAYGILNNGVRADGSVGKLYNDEPQLSVGITYAGLFRH